MDNSSLTGESDALERVVELLPVAGHEGPDPEAAEGGEQDGTESGGGAGSPKKHVHAMEASNLLFYSTILVRQVSEYLFTFTCLSADGDWVVQPLGHAVL